MIFCPGEIRQEYETGNGLKEIQDAKDFVTLSVDN